jgi:hypothetical protein
MIVFGTAIMMVLMGIKFVKRNKEKKRVDNKIR